jgi:hypothetical protein
MAGYFAVTSVPAVVPNVTVTEPAGTGWLTLYPTGAAQPNASDLNFAPGETRPNLVVVQVGTDRRVRLFTPARATPSSTWPATST